jgi:hypothetical protein
VSRPAPALTATAANGQGLHTTTGLMNTGTAGHLIAPILGVQYALLSKNAAGTRARTAVRDDAVPAHTRCAAVALQLFLILNGFG